MKVLAAGTLLVGLLCAGCGESAADKLDSEDAASRVEALQQLAREGDEAALALTERAVQHDDLETALLAVRTMGRMTADGAVDALARVVSEDDRAQVRRAAMAQLSRKKTAAMVPTFQRILRQDLDPQVRAVAATALGHLDDWKSLDLLIAAAEADSSAQVRGCAVGAIEQMGHVRFGYSPTAPADERTAALQRIRRWADNQWLPQNRR